MCRTESAALGACLALLALLPVARVTDVAPAPRTAAPPSKPWRGWRGRWTRATARGRTSTTSTTGRRRPWTTEGDAEVKAQAEAAYAEIRGQVAKALARDHVPMNGWFMGIFAALLLWGGMAWCLRIAMKSTPEHELDEDETWPIRPEEP